MIRMTVHSCRTHSMPVSVLHTKIISAVVMTWSSSVVEAILHILVVPRRIVSTMAAIGMMRVMGRKWHTRAIPGGGSP